MNLILNIIIAIVMAILAWLISKFWGYNLKKTFTTISGLAVVIPLLIIAGFGMLGMLWSEPEATQAIASLTIEKVVNYFANNILGIIISDIVGIIIGFVIGIFKGKRD